MKFRKWIFKKIGESDVARLCAAGYPALLAAVLASRGIRDAGGAAACLDRKQPPQIAPLLMRDMDRAIARIRTAIDNRERIAVYGDYDVDGITSTVLLVDYLRSREADVLWYIPRRVEDGYGLGHEALCALRQKGVSLIITVDCGITGIDEVAYAGEIGLDMVITDHHECKDALPAAIAVVDPKRPDCPYPFKHLAGVGVALKLVLAMEGSARAEAAFHRYCTLAAIGTVADVMEMTGENRALVCYGLGHLAETPFIGLKVLLRETGLDDRREITSTQIGFVLAPRLNAAGRMGKADLAAELLLCTDQKQAEQMARLLCALNQDRRRVEQEIYAQAEALITCMPAEERGALVLSSEAWHQGVVGIVASRLSEKYSCPSFMIHLQDGVGKGSCRSYGGFNLFSALERCADLLEDFGGHELAAGFNIREENIPAFRARMNGLVRAYCNGEPPVSSLEVDVVIEDPATVTMKQLAALDCLEPYGAGNAQPVFAMIGARLDGWQTVGQNRHIKVRLKMGNVLFDAIFFSVSPADFPFSRGAWVDAAFHLQINEFKGIRSVQLQLLDLRDSVVPCGSEGECLKLIRRLIAGGPVTRGEAERLLPEREQLADLWRSVCRACHGNPTPQYTLPVLRQFAAALRGSETFLHAALGLAIFQERGLVTIGIQDNIISICPLKNRRADLGKCRYMRQLRETLGDGDKNL